MDGETIAREGEIVNGSMGNDSNGEDTPRLALAVALLGIAGWVDAVGYLQFGGVFVSFMSGNTTQMAVSLGGAAWSQAVTIGVVIALFVAGVFCGTIVAGASGKWQLPMILAIDAG